MLAMRWERVSTSEIAYCRSKRCGVTRPFCAVRLPICTALVYADAMSRDAAS